MAANETWIWDFRVHGKGRIEEAERSGKALGRHMFASEDCFRHDLMRDRARSLHWLSQACMSISDDALIWHEGPSFGEFPHALMTWTGLDWNG